MGMEWTSPQHKASIDFYDRPEVQCVVRWPGAKLRAENKLAFFYLLKESRYGMDRISVTGAMVGAAQGTSGDAGTDRLETLERVGLIAVVDRDKQSGRWLIEVNNPLDVARAIRRAGDPQRLFGFLDDIEHAPSEADDRPVVGGVFGVTGCVPSLESSGTKPGASSGGSPEGSEEAPEVPRSASYTSGLSETSVSPSATLRLSTIGRPSVTLHSRDGSDESSQRARQPGTSSGGTSPEEARQLAMLQRQIQAKTGQRPAEPTVAAVMIEQSTKAAIDARLDRAKQHRDAEQLVKIIRDRVDDDALRNAPCLSLAWAVVEGKIERSDVMIALDNLDVLRDSGKLRSPGAYFVRCRDELFRRAGLSLPKDNAKPR